jgi:hypothetical protein
MKNLSGWIGAAILFILASCSEKSSSDPEPSDSLKPAENHAEIQYSHRPLLQFWTSTGCGGCGRFGIPVSEQVAEDMGDSILLLPTHFKYNDPFINDASLAIENNMVLSYHSPQIWVGGKDLIYDLISMSQSQAVRTVKNQLRDQLNTPPSAHLGAVIKPNDNDRFDVTLSIENASFVDQTLYLQLYAMEDGLIASQAGADPFVATHQRVMRDGFYDGMGKKLELKGGSKESVSFEYPGCYECDKNGLYFYIIAWKEGPSGKFEYVNGISVTP